MEQAQEPSLRRDLPWAICSSGSAGVLPTPVATGVVLFTPVALQETPPSNLVQHSGHGANLPSGGRASESAAAQGPDDAGQANDSRHRPSPTNQHAGDNDDGDNSDRRTVASALNYAHPTGTTIQPLVCISCNVQKSAQNTVTLLETNLDVDIICVQEIFHGVIKRVVSPSNPEGEEYVDTIAHRNFICIGARAESRVAIYLNKRWATASPSVHHTILHHPDIVCVTMHLSTGDFTFLNMYNDSRTHSAVQYLLDHSDRLPPIAFMAGDFNL